MKFTYSYTKPKKKMYVGVLKCHYISNSIKCMYDLTKHLHF